MRLIFTKKELRKQLLVGLIWTLATIVYLTQAYQVDLRISWAFPLPAVAYLVTYFHRKKYGYVSVQENTMTRHEPIFSKQINLNEVVTVRKFAGHYIFKTEKKELEINPSLMTDESKQALEEFIEKRNLPIS